MEEPGLIIDEMKRSGSPMLLFGNLDLSPLHSILWRGLHLERARDTYKKEFWTMKKETRTEHINAIKRSGDMNNNKMERFNGEIRDREKTMRGLKRNKTPILTGCQIFHNYVRGHEGLEGKTPAEACGNYARKEQVGD